jgi:tetratricopeptide (TPR) repeat protein
MSNGPDGDDAPIEIEPDPSEPTPIAPRAEGASAPPALPRPALETAAADDARADVALYEREAAATAAEADAGRRAPLLDEVRQLAGARLGDEAAALDAARRAFAADPAFVAGLWSLRRLLAARGAWQELADAYEAAVSSSSLAPLDRADLVVECGRLLEDRLGRDSDAAACYRVALTLDPEHPAALLSLLILGGRTGDAAAVESGLAGLARRTSSPGRQAALIAAAARAQRDGGGAAGGSAGASRALHTLTDALAAQPEDAPAAPLLAEMAALADAPGTPREVQAQALTELAKRVAGVDAQLGAAFLRARARLLGGGPAAVEALEQAAWLAPGNLLASADLMRAAEFEGKLDLMARALSNLETAAAPEDAAHVVELALAYVEGLGRAGRPADAMAALAAAAGGRAASGASGGALQIALLAATGDAAGLAEALASEAERAGGIAGARLYTMAAAIRRERLADPAVAEELYRRALAESPGYRPALDALDDKLHADGRAQERAVLLEDALGRGPDPEREAYLRGELVILYRDRLGAADRALAHQRRLVAMAPEDLRARVRLRDLELSTRGPARPGAAEQAGTVRALAAAAGDREVAAALKIEAARLLASGAGDEPRAEAARLLEEALPDDASGLAAAVLEPVLGEPADRATLVGAELAASEGRAETEIVHALRFRVAHHQAQAGQLPEAIATLTPLRAEGDPLARAVSWDLARRARDPILEVAVLSEEAPPVALGEALERAGDPAGAAAAFRRALAEAGPDALAVRSDAALGLLRLATTAPAASGASPDEALEALVRAAEDEPRIAAAARREQNLLRVTAGAVAESDLSGPHAEPQSAGAPRTEAAETAVLRWTAGVRRGDSRAVAEALLEMALGPDTAAANNAVPPALVPLLGRAAARARLGGKEAIEEVPRRAWLASRAPALAPAVADLPVAPGAAWPAARPDPRRARAARAPGALGAALELDVAFDAERAGALAAALAAYGRVIASEPDRVEAWAGIRRVARAGGDVTGEARALARLGALVKTPVHAAAFFVEAARLYEQGGYLGEAMALWGKALEVRPDDQVAFGRLHELLAGEQEAAGYAEALDVLLSHRLGVRALDARTRTALLLERAELRQQRLGDPEGAVQDFKRILKIEPQHEAALSAIAELAVQLGDHRAAAGFFERLVAVARDPARAAEARLELAVAYAASGERARAVETLRRAAALRPDDATPLDRLAQLYLKSGEWRSAVEALRASEARLANPHQRAALHLRIGTLLRDMGRDPAGAAQSFRNAADLNPLGDGVHALVALHDARGDAGGALETIEREIAELRQALVADPLDDLRLERLDVFLDLLATRAPGTPGVAEARAAVSEVRTLLVGAAPPPRASAPPLPVQPRGGAAFWSELAHPDALGFAAELWPHIVEAASAMFPPPLNPVPPRSTRAAPGSDPRLAWIEAAAAGMGIPDLRIFLAPADRAPARVTAAEIPEPALVLGPAALEPDPELRFQIGRALGLLRAQATVLEHAPPEALGRLFAAAAVVAGAPPAPGVAPPSDDTVRLVSRHMNRKDRKALGLQASRFGFDRIDPARWQQAVLRTAERFGLMVAGDAAAAVRALAGAIAPPETLRAHAGALELLRFIVGDRYPLSRHELAARGAR